MAGVRYLVPENRSQIVEPDLTSPHDDIGVHGHDHVSPVPAPREAYIADHADQPTAGDKDPEAMPPDLLQFVVERVVIGDQSQLALVDRVFLESPVRRRGDNQVDGFRGYPL